MKTRSSAAAPLLFLLAACATRGDEPGGGRDAPSNTVPEAVLSVTVSGGDGTETGPFSVTPDDLAGRAPGISRVGDFTSVTMVLMGSGADIGTVTLKTRSQGPGKVRLDDQGETADALRLVFFLPKGPRGVAGQYESVDGSAGLTAVQDDRIAGTFEGTFQLQHGGGLHRVRGSFDFRGSY